MKEGEKMRSDSGPSLCLPSVLSLLLRTAFQQPKPSHIRTEEDVFVSLSRAHL